MATIVRTPSPAPARRAVASTPLAATPALAPRPAAPSAPAAPAPAEAPPAPSRVDADLIRRRELAAFLRSRRERISPEQVGLPVGGRRRTPGLRREEVAQLAAVGVTWYTWLEQARDIQASAQVLDALARALRLDPNERGHLFVLANVPDPAPNQVCSAVNEPIRLMLEQLEPYPACVSNARYDILAYNRTYNLLVGDLDRMAPEDRNSMWLCFTDSAWREAFLDRDVTARAMVAKFRAAMADHVAEPAWKCLLRRLLAASPEFAEMWERHEVADPGNGTKRLLNPQVGLLKLDFTQLWAAPRQSARLITYTPADEPTRVRLERLHALAVAGDGGPGAARNPDAA